MNTPMVKLVADGPVLKKGIRASRGVASIGQSRTLEVAIGGRLLYAELPRER